MGRRAGPRQVELQKDLIISGAAPALEAQKQLCSTAVAEGASCRDGPLGKLFQAVFHRHAESALLRHSSGAHSLSHVKGTEVRECAG
eukprot:313249-Pyramimonas_sp.AAC.1